MLPEMPIDQCGYHYLMCPSRKTRKQIRITVGSILMSGLAIYGVYNFNKDQNLIVDSFVDSNSIDLAQHTFDVSNPDKETASITSPLDEALLKLNVLEHELAVAQSENAQLSQESDLQKAINDELISKLTSFKSGALYLKDKYADFAYAFKLDDAEVVPLAQGISGGKVKLAAISSLSQQIPLGTVFDRPYRISSFYGSRNIKGHPRASKDHKGIDFPVRTGTPIYAPADGYVEAIQASKRKVGSGNFIRLQHAHGFQSSYSHLSKFAVKSGAYVQKGDLIGYSGNTGYTTGAHLHYEIKFRGHHIDPKPLFSYKPGSDISTLRDTSIVDWDKIFSMYESKALATAVIFRP